MAYKWFRKEQTVKELQEKRAGIVIQNVGKMKT